MRVNIPLVTLYVGAVAFGLGLGGLIYAVTQARTHIKTHGLVGGLMEWWLYGRQANWSKEAVTVQRRSDYVKSIRVSDLELEHLAAAAAKRGLTLGQYIKRAAIQRASDDRMLDTVTATAGYGYVLAGRISEPLA